MSGSMGQNELTLWFTRTNVYKSMKKQNDLPFEKLREELSLYIKTLEKAAEVIVTQEVSIFPIFVVHQHTVDIGINIIDRESVKGNWSVNASTLEEFVTKQILSPQKLEDFKLVYKNHEGDLCLFVLSELGANFVFLPTVAE